MSDLTLLNRLNPAQAKAVSAHPCHQLIIAGAGSGKTRVLVHRIAWLVTQLHVPGHAIMAVTFTNKAANTLKTRTESLMGQPLQGGWIGTFHSLCHRLLRQYAFDFELDPNFQIIDSDDQLRLLKKIQQDAHIDDKQWPVKKTQWIINQAKEQGIRSPEFQDPSLNHSDSPLCQVYRTYEKICKQDNLVDFNELILKVVEVLQQKPSFCEQIHAKFRHILVDEFQDSNPLQYQLIKSLAGQQSYVSIVGDDDQSIYSWRGARVENMRSFPQDYPDVMTIKLEQNYRSTGVILEAANHLIANNQHRLGKELQSTQDAGDPIMLFSGYNEYEEARFIAQSIQQRHQMGLSLSDQAVLYRSNAQSRIIEEQLARHGLAYRVYGGLRFFDRAEIKDILAYLRLIVNPADSTAFLRVINTPTRGIGQSTLEKIQACSQGGFYSQWHACEQALNQGIISGKAKKGIESFMSNIQTLQDRCQHDSLSHIVEQIVQTFAYLDHIQKQHSDQAKIKLENIEELINACAQFESETSKENTLFTATHFLANITLDSHQNKEDQPQDCVQLMTLHSAKGLEFDTVFLCGMEEGLCPHKMSLHEEAELEEERRLCYVGITRAKTNLIITHAECRRLFNQENYQQRSRFLSEIPGHLIQPIGNQSATTKSFNVNVKTHSKYTASNQSTHGLSSTSFDDEFSQAPHENTGEQWRLGQTIYHSTFGPGIILNLEGSHENTRLQIRFKDFGVKWLLASYVKPCCETL